MSLYHNGCGKCMVSFFEVILKFPGIVKFPGYREIVEENSDLFSSTWLWK